MAGRPRLCVGQTAALLKNAATRSLRRRRTALVALLDWWESGRRLCGGNEIVDDEDPGPLRVAHGNLSGQALLLALDAMVGAQYTVSRACTSSNRFIIGVAGWKFVFGQEDVESLFFFLKLKR